MLDYPYYTKLTHSVWLFNPGWFPGRKSIAYDVYKMNFIEKLKLVNIDNKSAKELISTEDILNSTDTEKPVLILFSDWVVK